MELSRQEYWSGLPCPLPGYLPDPGIEPRSPALQADSLLSEPPGKPIIDIKKALKAGKGDGNPLQCSCLKNPRDGGAWGAAVCGVAQSQTRLKRLSSSSSNSSKGYFRTEEEYPQDDMVGRGGVVVQSLGRVRVFVTPWTAAHSLWPHGLPPCPSSTPGVCSNWSHPLSSPSPPAFSLSQHQGLFQWVSFSHQVAKVLEFHLQHQSFQWKFRTDFL